MTYKQNLITLYHSQGIATSDIAKKVNCTVRYVNQIINVIKSNENKLNIPNYFLAKSHGLKTQKQLADWFHVTTRTIRNFENKNDIKNLERLYHELIFGNYFAQLKNELHQISDLLNICAPDSKHLLMVKQMLEVLEFATK
uniref:Transposase n=1 Tax=Podoviridae sp. ctARy1 TaxID=2825228 RepID=A0A8S5TSM8_9CAUD|nr:MAG TPA: transposase [Podoviridae sp. ctARy1]